MAWLSDWLRQIIAIILLAGIIDLLLPSSVYQRYVRLVVGLLILLTLLSPVLRLLQGDFNTKLDDMTEWPIVANTGKMQELESIQEQGRRLQEERMKKAEQLTERRLASVLLEQLPNVTGYPLADVEVRIVRNERTGEQVVASVDIVLKGNVKVIDRTDVQDKDQTVKTVEPVTVEVGVPVFAQEEEAESSSEDLRGGSVYPLSSSDVRFRNIASVLMNNWGIDPEVVRINAPAEEMTAEEVREGHGGGGLAD
ncbi:stage III sporulation protein AF [Paenibacillus tarimensis]